jgi:hypothetical protein
MLYFSITGRSRYQIVSGDLVFMFTTHDFSEGSPLVPLPIILFHYHIVLQHDVQMAY